jgi:ankyrin repeat protein
MTVAVSSAPSLHEAASKGDIDTFNAVVKSVEDLNVTDSDGRTPLHLAAMAGESTVGAYIAECGGDVAIQDKDGNTALHLAAINNKRLFVSMLLWGEADPLAVNAKGNTALHEAAERGHVPVIYIILQNGGDSAKDVKNNDGKSPLDLARDNGHQEAIACIESGDADF